MNSKKAIGLAFLLGALALAGLLPYRLANTRGRVNQSISSGELLPDFRLRSLDGEWLSKGELEGRRFAMLMFSVACSYCMEELRVLDQIALDTDGQAIEIIAASLDSPRTTLQLRAELSLRVRLYTGDSKLAKSIGLRAVPSLLLVDEHGRLRYSHMGQRSKEFLELVLGRFINGESLEEQDLRVAYNVYRHCSPCKNEEPR